MKIRSKVAGLVLSLVAVVVGMVAANLMLVERAGLEREHQDRTDTLLEGISRLARESLMAKDELMLLSYLMFLMKDHPELEIAIVSRKGHTSVVGSVKTELFYRAITLTDPSAAQFKSAPAPSSAGGEGAGGSGPPSPEARAVLRSPEGNLPEVRVSRTSGNDTLPPSTFMIQLGFSRTLLDSRISRAGRTLMGRIAAIAAAGLLLAAAGSWWLGKLISKPITELARASESLAAGDLEARVDPGSKDELGELGRSFNSMAGRLREQIRFKEDLLSTLSHELKTPLGGLKGYVELLESSPEEPPKERAKSFKTMADTIGQMEKSLDDALDLAAKDSPAPLDLVEVRPGEIASQLAELFSPAARSAGIILERDLETTAAVKADRELMRRVLANLLSNALKYTPAGGTVRVKVAAKDSGVLLSVSDTGPGISRENQDLIFTKFYRAPQADGSRSRIPGSGLGLAIAKSATERQGGKIWVESEKGKGSVFKVLFRSA